MLQWTVVFLVLALVAAVLGFGRSAGRFAGSSGESSVRRLSGTFLALFLISLITGVVGRPPA